MSQFKFELTGRLTYDAFSCESIMHLSDLAIEQVEHLGYFCLEAMLQIVPGRLAISFYPSINMNAPHTKKCSFGHRKFLPLGDQGRA